MHRTDLADLLNAISATDLTNLIPLKRKLDLLHKRKKELERNLAGVHRHIESVESSLGETLGQTAIKKFIKGERTGIAQPSLGSLVVEILGENKKPLTVNEIHDALLGGKKYRTQAKDFKANIRILLYRNDKGLFRRVRPGEFTLKKAQAKIEKDPSANKANKKFNSKKKD